MPQGKRGNKSSGARAGLVVDNAAAPTMPAPAAAGGSGPAALAARAFDGTEATATSANPPSKRSPVVPIFGAAVVVALGLLAFAVVVDPWGAKELPATTAGLGGKPVDDKPVDDKPVADKPVDVKPIAAVDAQPLAADDDKPVDVKPVSKPKIDDEPVVDDGKKKPKRPVVRDKPIDKDKDRDKPAERDDKRDDKSGDGQERLGDGTLTLDTVPWTVVYLGKRKLGETPLNKVPVPAGALELLLVNPEANVRETYIANVKPGAEYRARLDLN
jgi:hypothetical protein